MEIKGANVIKKYLFNDGKVESIMFTNTLSNITTIMTGVNEFIVGYVKKKLLHNTIKYIKSNDCVIVKMDDNCIWYECSSDGYDFKFKLINEVTNGYITARVEIDCSDENLILDSIEYLNVSIDKSVFSWSRPIVSEKITIASFFTALGQPVYYKDLFMGVEFMTADNCIQNGRISLKYYFGRSLAQLGADYKIVGYVVGGGIRATMIDMQNAFFEYVGTFARPNKFRIQYNSWYDNMLDIDSDNIEKSFKDIASKFKKSGLRDLDCYVVDDGWVDYRKSEFWAFNDKFPDGFNKECKIVEELGSTFGVWFGPIGGYSEARSYSKKLEKIGYNTCNQSGHICVGDPSYVDALTDKMIEFVDKYNVDYFKIDGFSGSSCKGKNHGHPVGGYENLYFYTFQWEQWCKSFAKVREAAPDIFLNVTSHSNCSAWLLKDADAVWLNNCKDMDYEGSGSNLQQCLNYRDGRYHDFTHVRQLQFPLAYIYNHEPCYAERNYNPPLPSLLKKVVKYTDAEFEQYLYMCIMRGTGFIELYYSPSMMTEGKLAVNARVLKWGEENFDIIKKVKYFGNIPSTKCVYGYIGFEGNKGIVALRNASDKAQNYTLNLNEHSDILAVPMLEIVYGDIGNVKVNDKKLSVTMQPNEVIIINIKY